MSRTQLMEYGIVFLAFWLFFLLFQSSSIYGGDAGDMVTAALTGSTAHPPGYPLYSFIGWLLSHIPLSTPAWRVGLLSSTPAAGTLVGLWILISSLTRSRLASLLTTSSLAVSYVFWLYAIVPEVFALLTFFITILILLARWYSHHPTTLKSSIIAGVMGLSLSHHHIIVFTFPTICIYMLYTSAGRKLFTVKHGVRAFFVALCGLLPYTWAVYGAYTLAPLVWSNPNSVSNLIRLFTRADYGSFQSGTVYGEHIGSRLLQLVALSDFALQDFTLIGLVLAFFGYWGLFKHSKKDFWALGTGLVLSGPVYFFYASYLYSSRFHIATAERFVLPLYVYISIGIGYGMYYVLSQIKKSHTPAHMMKIYAFLVIGASFLVPLSQFSINFPKLSVLRTDSTAEKFGYDILRSLEPNSVLMLQGDHPVFNTQYVYYGLKYRTDVQLIHVTKLLNKTGIGQLRSQYPTLTLTSKGDPAQGLVHDIEKNYARFPIYANTPLQLIPEGYRWVPYGLLFRLYKESDVPPYSEVFNHSESVWSHYQDPLSGSLGSYAHLMLFNIADYYRDAHVRRGLYAVEYGKDFANALSYYSKALEIDPTSGAIHYLLGDALSQQGSCSKALQMYKKGYSLRSDDPSLWYDSMIELYSLCFKDTHKAKKWQEEKKSYEQKQEKQLQAL